MRYNQLSPKKYYFHNDASKKLLKGVETVANAVIPTMGPNGRLVQYYTPDYLWPLVTKDGVSVAQQVILKDFGENFGAEKVKEAADRQLRDCGDGTTLTILLAHELFKGALKSRSFKKNIHHFILGMEMAIYEVRKLLETNYKINKRYDSDEIMAAVATIACNNDPHLGELISKGILKTGEHGIVSYRKNKDKNKIKDYLEYTEGYSWESGVENLIFVNNEKGMFHEDPLILVTDHILEWGKELSPLATEINDAYPKARKPLVIIAYDVIGEFLQTLTNTHQEKGNPFNISFLKPSGLDLERNFCLEDIAAFTGATFISNDSKKRIQDVKLKDLGTCKTLFSDHNKTTIVDGLGNTKIRQDHLKLILENSNNEEEKMYAKKSLSNITGGAAVIYAVGSSDSEMEEKLHRIDDSIRATKIAIEHGVVAGGGWPLYHYSLFLEPKGTENSIQDSGWNVVRKAIKQPLRQILLNANNNPNELEKQLIKNCAGYDAKLLIAYKKDWDLKTVRRILVKDGMTTFSNIASLNIAQKEMIENLIVDPVKVIDFALSNAFSVVKLLLQTAVLIVPETSQ